MNISIVIPTINSETIIEDNLKKIDSIIRKKSYIKKYEIIIAAQNSDDKTFEVIKNNKIKNVKKIFIRERGKGIGLSYGMKKARYPLILMTDDDVPYDINKFLDNAKKNIHQEDIIIGSRYLKKVNNNIPITRRFASYSYRIIVKILFSIPQKDVQAGIKLIKKSVFEKVGFPNQKGYIWDTELLYKANKKNMKIIEIPMSLKQKSNKLKIQKDFPKMLKDILILWVKERIFKC
jgi:glycosyltransferase involved in cell wall biosynthesis